MRMDDTETNKLPKEAKRKIIEEIDMKYLGVKRKKFYFDDQAKEDPRFPLLSLFNPNFFKNKKKKKNPLFRYDLTKARIRFSGGEIKEDSIDVTHIVSQISPSHNQFDFIFFIFNFINAKK